MMKKEGTREKEGERDQVIGDQMNFQEEFLYQKSFYSGFFYLILSMFHALIETNSIQE